MLLSSVRGDGDGDGDGDGNGNGNGNGNDTTRCLHSLKSLQGIVEEVSRASVIESPIPVD